MVRLIAEREVRERLRGRTTRIMTVATALLVVLGVTLPTLFKGSSRPARIGLVGAAARRLEPAVAASARSAGVRVVVSSPADRGVAAAELRDGRLDVALTVGSSRVLVEVKQTLGARVGALLRAAVSLDHLHRVLSAAQVPAATVAAALRPVAAKLVAIEPRPPDQAARTVAAIAAGLLMYISLAVYGGAVATGVAQEKTSRTAEVLLASVRPGQLLAGKVIGIGLTGLGQLATAAIAGLLADAVVHSARIPGNIWALFPAFLAFFLAGFVLYAFAFAAAGALVARQEEVQAVTAPLAMPLLIGYLLVYVAVASPNAAWVRIVSFVPPLTATLMPARIALGHVAWWEIPVQAALMLGSIAGVARLASRVYASALIHSGPRLRWRGALKLPAAGR